MTWQEVIARWEPLGEVPPGAITEARLQAHWAAQVVAAHGISFVTPEPDDGHTAMTWLPGPRVLAGQAGENGLRIGLSVSRLALVSLGDDGEVAGQLPLAGRTLDEAYQWLASEALGAGEEDPDAIRRPAYEMPRHAVGLGGRFGGPVGEALEELERWYSNASRLIEALAGENPDATPVRCWPHHFDMATLIVFDPDEPDADRARSIGVGMSPGDASYPEPYFYVNPWPPPEVVQFPALDGEAQWHTDGWLGAVLPASRLTGGGRIRDHAEQIGAFLASSMTAERALLDL